MTTGQPGGISRLIFDKFNTIEDAWFTLCSRTKISGEEYTIDKGSFAGCKRRQLPFTAFMVLWPWTRPLSVTYKGQNIITQEQAEKYFAEYLLNPNVAANEQYTYGSRIAPQLDTIINMLSKTPMTNQAVIEVAQPSDLNLPDPPCLRVVSWKVSEKKLNLCCYFRSWDLYAGLPTNLCGLQFLNEYIAEMTGLSLGKLIAFSDGAHLYDYAFDLI